MKRILGFVIGIGLTASLFSASPSFEVGVNVGALVEQRINTTYEEKMIYALPELGVTADLQFEKFGLQGDFGFSWQNINFYANSSDTKQTSEKITSEMLTLTPYVPFYVGNFTFKIGATVGVHFEQSKYSSQQIGYTQDYENFSFVFGGMVGAKYSLSDKLNLFLNIPVLCHPYVKTTKISDSDNTAYKLPDGSWSSSTIFVVPNLGLAYRF